LLIAIGALAFLGDASRGLLEPLAKLEATPLSLDPIHLPEYAARTTLRMFAGLALSLLFTFTYATWAAKSERAAKLLVPMLDILQSVPILGFISVTVVFFMSLAPGRVLGAELAAIFAIFTSQAWNMAFSFYQSLRTVPAELSEAASSFHLSPWMRFWQLEVPFALPGLIWNTMMSMSGGWFFVVASESIAVGHTNVALPGVGSYIAAAIAQRDLHAIGWAILTMLVVILAYDQLLFRPLVAWVDGLRFEQDPGGHRPRSWALTVMRRSRLISGFTHAFYAGVRWASWAMPLAAKPRRHETVVSAQRSGLLWGVAVVALVVCASVYVGRLIVRDSSMHDVFEVLGLALATMVRVFVLIALASLV
jgi:NitT/TauT family transport system permease protein